MGEDGTVVISPMIQAVGFMEVGAAVVREVLLLS